MRGQRPSVFPRGRRLPGSRSQRPPSSLVWLYPEGKGLGAATGALPPCCLPCAIAMSVGAGRGRAERWERCWQGRIEAPEIGRSAGCVAGKVLARPVVGIGRLGESEQVKQVKVHPGECCRRSQGVELLSDVFSEPESHPDSMQCRNKPREALITRFCLVLEFSGRYRWKRPERQGTPYLHM